MMRIRSNAGAIEQKSTLNAWGRQFGCDHVLELAGRESERDCKCLRPTALRIQRA